jgi:hypothetical protein
MTNDEALVNIASAQQILRGVLTTLLGAQTAADILAETTPITAPAGTSVVGKFITNKGVYDAAPDTFVSTPANITAMDAVVDAIVATTIPDFATISGTAYDALQAAAV